MTFKDFDDPTTAEKIDIFPKRHPFPVRAIQISHKPCASRGECYHRKNGRKNVESGQLDRIRELPQAKEAQQKVGRKNAESGHLNRIRELPQTKEAQRKAGRRRGRKNAESGHLNRIRELPQTKEAQRKAGRKNVESGALARARAIHNNPSKEEIERLHKRLPDWEHNVYIDPHDGGAPVEVDSFRGKVTAFYDGTWYHGTPKRRAQDRCQRERLTGAGYFVRVVVGRAPSDAEVLEWNMLADFSTTKKARFAPPVETDDA